MNLLKKEIRAAVSMADFDKVISLALANKRVFSILISLTYDKEDPLCWKAIEAVGKAANAFATENASVVRNLVQRLLWSVSEESGGIGWSAAEMLGEVVINCPSLTTDIPPIIFSLHIEESFLRGVLWALGRMAAAGIDRVEGAQELALRCLNHKDPAVRGLALYALAQFGNPAVHDAIYCMVPDRARFRIYNSGTLIETTVGEIAQTALKNLPTR